MSQTPTASISRSRYIFLATALLLFGVAWASRHAVAIGNHGSDGFLWVFMAATFIAALMLGWFERPHKVHSWRRDELDKLIVTVNVPLYNEDPAITRQVLEAFLCQTRKPNRVEVVDDGSSIDYTDVSQWWIEASRDAGIDGTWVRVENGGKRHAQITTFSKDTTSDIFVTVDSDSVLAPNAIEEGLLPFRKPEIMSVAAIVMAINAKTNLITRMTDLMFLNFQLVNRSGLFVLKSVLVNSGCLAFYRAEVIREALDGYGNETFAGRGVQFSDDSFLTLAAHLKGETVQQPTSICYTWLPEKVGHHLRQQLRWNRGSTIRSIWRFRYLPMTRWSYWVHFLNWMNFAILLFVFGYIVVYQPVINGHATPWLAAVSVMIGYLTSMKYLTIKRSDVSKRWQLATFAMAPLLMLWNALVLRPLRIYGMLTCWKTGWGTRQSVEVSV